MVTPVRVYTSEEIREQLRLDRGWIFTDDDWRDAYQWSMEGRELTVGRRESGTYFAAEIIPP